MKIPQMPQKCSTQFVCPSPKLWDFRLKTFWVSVVRGKSQKPKNFHAERLKPFHSQLLLHFAEVSGRKENFVKSKDRMIFGPQRIALRRNFYLILNRINIFLKEHYYFDAPVFSRHNHQTLKPKPSLKIALVNKAFLF